MRFLHSSVVNESKPSLINSDISSPPRQSPPLEHDNLQKILFFKEHRKQISTEIISFF